MVSFHSRRMVPGVRPATIAQKMHGPSRCHLCHHRRMTWWQTLIVTVMPVVLTTAALLGQQWMTDRRAERSGDGEQRAKALDEARQVHADLLSESLALWRPLGAVLDRATIDYGATGSSRFRPVDVRPLDLSRADVALARLMVRESEEVADAAAALVRHAESVLSSMQALNAGLSEDTASELAQWAEETHQQLMTTYMRLAKESVRAIV